MPPKKNKQPFQCYVIGVCGGSGSGMSSFARQMYNHYTTQEPGIINVLHAHHYFVNRQGYKKNKDGEYIFDLPDNFNLAGLNMDLAHLQIGGSFGVPIRDFESGKIEGYQSFNVVPIVIVEGLFLLYYKALRNQVDYMVFLDAPTEVRKNRRLTRDSWIDEKYYNQFIEPAYTEYVLAHKHKANTRVDTSAEIEAVVFDRLVADIDADREFQLSRRYRSEESRVS